MTDLVIVEDNELDLHLLERVLNKEVNGINYKTFADGASAMDYFENSLNTLPRLILLDIKIPKVNGLEILRRLKTMEHTADIPTVILSSSNQKKDIKLAYEYGGNGFLTKPGDYKVLKSMIKTTIDYWINYNKTILNNE